MASAVTPSLYIKTDIPLKFEHEYTDSFDVARQYLEEGKTVLVPNGLVAYKTLKALGLNKDDAGMRVKIAMQGPTAVGAVDPNHPVPRAPGADDPVQEQQQHGGALTG